MPPKQAQTAGTTDTKGHRDSRMCSGGFPAILACFPRSFVWREVLLHLLSRVEGKGNRSADTIGGEEK